jgi:hypothetical protein
MYNIDRRTELLVLKNVVLLQVLWKERDLCRVYQVLFLGCSAEMQVLCKEGDL